tara:strand:- start:1124 stop:1642 length:519 start_codon:yes stop_codon:yes gene_type:complete
MAFKMKGNPIKLGGMATKAVAKMKEPMKMKSPMELKEKSPVELEKESAMDMKEPMKMKSPMEAAAKPDFPDIDGDGDTNESMKKAAADKRAGGPQMKSPMEAEHGDSPMEAEHGDSPAELESPTKKIKYFGQRTSGSEVTEVMNHNKKYHTDPKREGNKLSNEVVKPGHPDH